MKPLTIFKLADECFGAGVSAQFSGVIEWDCISEYQLLEFAEKLIAYHDGKKENAGMRPGEIVPLIASDKSGKSMLKFSVVYADGSCLDNGKEDARGGWGYVVLDREGDDAKIVSKAGGGVECTTNNQMELMAAIRALEDLEKGSIVWMNLDSKYVLDGITKWCKNWQKNGWLTSNKQPVKNEYLWKRLLDAVERHQSIELRWVKGHSSSKWNNYVDELAQGAARAL